MKPQPRRSEDPQARFEANLEARVWALFRCHPALCGFSVGEGPSMSLLTEVSVYPASGPAAPPELCFEVLATLADLVEECPEAHELLRGRTFARVLH